ncbi:MAG TPA: histidinol dehydrogenase [Sphingobacteriaceae bacterium]
MKLYNFSQLDRPELEQLCQRNADTDHTITGRVEAILQEVREEGDEAVRRFTLRFDKVETGQLYLDRPELEELASSVGAAERQALETAYQNILKFHQQQLIREDRIETTPGVTCWREARAIERVGFYIPGGSAVLPSTFLMLGIPAKIAGCSEVVVCTPPQQDGRINGYIAWCAIRLDIGRVYLAGGAQAVAAMAYGTETIPKVDKIFGPGNQYVTRAKSLVQANSAIAIDMPAGPSEVLVIADETARPAYVAADLLAQAEHGADSQSILVSPSAALIGETIREIESQLRVLPRAEIASKAIANSYAMKVESLEQAMEFSNRYAPEHLILQTDRFQDLIPMIRNAGSVFLGHLTPESAGDYASGTNHTLPTSGYARSYSGVSVDSFIKKITFQMISREGIRNLGPTVEVLAELEGLAAHRNAVSIRLKD